MRTLDKNNLKTFFEFLPSNKEQNSNLFTYTDFLKQNKLY